jgi:cell division protein FtsI (penicillin-binding protein 3)
MIVKDIVDSKGRTVEQLESKVLRQVISQRTAQKVCEMMALVTQEGGTGVGAALPGYTVAGKTGTAQKVDPTTKRYSRSKYTAVFTGFAPVDRPRLAMTAVIHEPQGAIYGGVVAAPVFRNIASQALPYLKVPPSGSDGETIPIPGVRYVNAAFKAQEKPVAPHADTDQNVMPDLTGLSLKMALQQLAPMKAKMKCKGSGRVVDQSPPAGTPIEPMMMVELALKESP